MSGLYDTTVANIFPTVYERMGYDPRISLFMCPRLQHSRLLKTGTGRNPTPTLAVAAAIQNLPFGSNKASSCVLPDCATLKRASLALSLARLYTEPGFSSRGESYGGKAIISHDILQNSGENELVGDLVCS